MLGCATHLRGHASTSDAQLGTSQRATHGALPMALVHGNELKSYHICVILIFGTYDIEYGTWDIQQEIGQGHRT